MGTAPNAASIMPDGTVREEGPREVRPKRAAPGKRRPPPDKERLTRSIVLKHPRTGKTAQVTVGFAWTLFLFSGLLGAPLFLRGLHRWGAVILVLWIADLAAGESGAGIAGAAQAALFCAFLVVQTWLGLKDNELTAKAYVERGWTIADPGSAATKHVVARWGLEAP